MYKKWYTITEYVMGNTGEIIEKREYSKEKYQIIKRINNIEYGKHWNKKNEYKIIRENPQKRLWD
jgi:hypothetical protein